MSSILKVSEIQDPTNNNSALTIDSSGRVMMPQKPAFRASYGTSGAWISAGANNTNKILEFTTASVNVGGHWSTSTHDFTVPVAGTYFFYAQAYFNSNDDNRELRIQRTFAAGGTDYVHTIVNSMEAGRDQTVTVSDMYSLAVGDKVDFYFRVASSGSNDVYARDDYTWAMGYLVG